MKPKVLSKRCFKNFSEQSFLQDLKQGLSNTGNFSDFNSEFKNTLNNHAPIKTSKVRGNAKPHVNKNLRKEIMKRSNLKNIANKSGKTEDKKSYKIQRNVVTKLNKKLKKAYFKAKIPKGKDVKHFWNFCKPYFTNKGVCNDEKIILVEKEEVLRKDSKISDTFNNYFVNITDELGIYNWGNIPQNCLDIAEKIKYFNNHPSIKTIKNKFRKSFSFKFEFVSADKILRYINEIDIKKSSSGEISPAIIKLAKKEILIPITNCINKCISTVLMDLSKAYDCLPHDLLIAKLAAYGFEDSATSLISDYLSKRYQRVKIGSVYSSYLEILRGVPQGSILGPILLNIFINDLIFFIQETEVCNFADDTAIYSCSLNYKDAAHKLSNDTHTVLNWFKVNNMVANPGKFQIMFLGSKIDNCKITFAIENKQIKCKREVKHLGITIDEKLIFTKHIANICSLANNRLRALTRIRRYLSKEQTKYLSEAYIISAFKYCPLIWMFCNKTSNNQINKIHKRSLRLIYEMQDANFEDLLLKDNSWSVHESNIHTLLIEIYKSINNLSPPIMKNFFDLKNTRYDLLNKQLLKLPETNTSRYGTQALCFRGSLIWNTVPNKIKNIGNIEEFKKHIKEWKPTTCSCKLCL